MFRGRFEHTIDSKGRLSIPSRFRDMLAERYDSRLVITTFDGCLSVYPYAEWKRFEEKLSALPEFKKGTRDILRYFYSSATDCAIDKLGRILVPQSLRDFGKLEKDVVIVGAFKRMEIWSKLKWDIEESKISHEAIADTLEDLGL